MTDIDHRLARDRILTRDDDLDEVLGLLLQHAINPRQLWLIFLDADGRLVDPLMPCDDYPPHPSESPGTADLAFARDLGHRLRYIVEATGAASVVLVWERVGPPRFGVDERTWARAMAQVCRESELHLRGQFVLHDEGVRMLSPDDYADAAGRG
jgi:hypothetical protein